MACARKQNMWYALVIICAFLYLFANGQQTRIMTASVSAINFQELNLVAYKPVMTLGACQGATAEQMPGNCMPKG